MNITVVGTGYVGLVTGVCFAETGNQVTCVDIDEKKVLSLESGQIPIYEPGLEDLFRRNREAGRISFTTSLADAAPDSDIIFLALPTPPKEDGSADLSYVLNVARSLGPLLNGYTVVVNKSTVPVGTASRVSSAISIGGKVPGKEYDVISNPEFLREGCAIQDFMRPERVVIGTRSHRAAAIMKRLYAPFVRNGNPVLIMDEKSAEMTKYAANAFLATKISFMNEIANLCTTVGANVDDVRGGIGTDSRIGKKFLYPGLGFGGSCFPKDVRALNRTAAEEGYNFRILDAVLGVNADQSQFLVDRIFDLFGGSLNGRSIAVWGLAFKAQTDDVRESPAHTVIKKLVAAGARIHAYDPEAMPNTQNVLGDLSGSLAYADDMFKAVEGADALVVCTEWAEFREPDLVKLRTLMKCPRVFDGRNLYDPTTLSSAGFEYVSVGRPSQPARLRAAPSSVPHDAAYEMAC